MALSVGVGDRVGPYAITACLGVGGMGEVYRAFDVRTRRTVAIKILSPTHAASPVRRHRFETELRALAALNHPGIVALYDVGFDEGRPFIVTEHLEGQTLRDRLTHPPSIPVRVAWAIEIARALAAAHRGGILQGDLKPENIFITTDGRVKLLDFGLAGTIDDAAEPHETDTECDDERAPRAGTAAYMSPEQVLGRSGDKRADIFSFGCVLYELLTGESLFLRAARVDTMHAVVHEGVPPSLALDPHVPRPVVAVIGRCLAKVPADRFQSADDLAFSLALEADPPPAVVSRPSRLRLGIGAAAMALIGVAGVGEWRFTRAAPPAPPVPRFTQLTFRRGYVANARFSPDGRTVVYGATWDGMPFRVFTTQPDSPESRALDVPPGSILAVSRSGELALLLGCDFTPAGPGCDGTLARIPATGAAPRPLLEHVHWADWSPDGQLAVVRVVGDRYRLEYPIGHVLREIARPGFIGHVRFSPSGNLIAFFEQSSGAYSLNVTTTDGSVRTVVAGLGISFGLAWTPDGREIWYSSYAGLSPFALFATDLEGHQRLITRPPGGVMVMDIARDGRVLAASYDFRSAVMARLDGDSDERDYSVFNNAQIVDLSADGSTLLLMDRPHGGPLRQAAYVRRRRDPAPIRLFEAGRALALSPDGAVVLRTTRETGALDLVPVGPGEPQSLSRNDGMQWYGGEFPLRGEAVLVTGASSGEAPRCFVQPLGGGAPRPVTPPGVVNCDISPDGTLVAAGTGAPDGALMLFPVAGGTPRAIAGAVAGDNPVRWTNDGRHLYVRGREQVPAMVFGIDLVSGRRDPWRAITPLDPAGVFNVDGPLLTSDGRSYAYAYRRFQFDLYQVDGLR